jgi:hypothetical protein
MSYAGHLADEWLNNSLALSFKRSLLAANMSANSIICYLDAVNFPGDFLESQGMTFSPVAQVHLLKSNLSRAV